jgi:predicted esterase/catechol 2,3-dioxygenase-like lactoylglutathione lyase family enzyme
MHTENAISGIHHITAVASSAAENRAFYENILGLRLVKQTVNFDDPDTYHLYYGDAQGTPGTILTFFPWEKMPPGKPGAGMVTAIAFAVPQSSMAFWAQRIGATGQSIQTGERFGDPTICFADPHGLPLELIGSAEASPGRAWDQSPIPPEHAILGFHSATASLHAGDDMTTLLVKRLGMRLQNQAGNRYRFMMTDPVSPGHYLDLVVDDRTPAGRPGGGTVHHIAWRTASAQTLSEWQSRLRQNGLAVTDVRDRHYFRSIYFSSPGGVLFEIATDTPGFAIDESPETLGAVLKLPHRYESMRADIGQRLPPLSLAPFQYVTRKAAQPAGDDRTIVTLHGTGGSEHDLVDLARDVAPSADVISPRGNVLENGKARFFRRLANNVFDEEDLVPRAHALAHFLRAAAFRQGRHPKPMTALGYSNGANMAAAILLVRPEVFASAVLIRPMRPLRKPSLPDLQGKAILILKGADDTIIPAQSTDALIAMLEKAGAAVTSRTIKAGHEITPHDMDIIAGWLSDQSAADDRAALMSA